MPKIRYATPGDKAFWYTLDKHLSEREFQRKMLNNEAYVMLVGDKPIGILRYNLFWDNTPFCNLIYIDENYRGMSYGKALMEYWENDMLSQGFDMVLTSTQTDENAQHFYRKLGYRENGCMTLAIKGHEQPMEMFFVKALSSALTLETERTVLRPWLGTDADYLYELASDPDVGPSAGWRVHDSVEDSLGIIYTVLSLPHTMAVVLKENGLAVGSIGLMPGNRANTSMPEDEAEVGYWIGKPYWGRGLIPEAVRELMRYGFEDLGFKKLWCCHFDGNEKSKRVIEKCGFKFSHTEYDKYWAMIGEHKTEHYYSIAREEWQNTK